MPPNCHYLGHHLKSAYNDYIFLFFFLHDGWYSSDFLNLLCQNHYTDFFARIAPLSTEYEEEASNFSY